MDDTLVLRVGLWLGAHRVAPTRSRSVAHPSWLTVAQVAAWTGLSPKAVRRRADRGTLPCGIVDGQRRFDPRVITALVEAAAAAAADT